MIPERLTQIEISVTEQRRITLDYLERRRVECLNALNNYGAGKNDNFTKMLRKELAVLYEVIKILEQEI